MGRLRTVCPPGDEGGTLQLRCDAAIRCAWHPGGNLLASGNAVGDRQNSGEKTDSVYEHRRNEVKSKVLAGNVLRAVNGSSKPLYIASKEEIVQRAAILLKDVDYLIEAHFEMTERASAGDNPGKFKDIVMRRLRRGECFHMPYFGCREFPANFELYEADDLEDGDGREQDLGYMLYDFDYSDPEDIKPMFFRAVLRNGILDVRDCEVVR